MYAFYEQISLLAGRFSEPDAQTRHRKTTSEGEKVKKCRRFYTDIGRNLCAVNLSNGPTGSQGIRTVVHHQLYTQVTLYYIILYAAAGIDCDCSRAPPAAAPSPTFSHTIQMRSFVFRNDLNVLRPGVENYTSSRTLFFRTTRGGNLSPLVQVLHVFDPSRIIPRRHAHVYIYTRYTNIRESAVKRTYTSSTSIEIIILQHVVHMYIKKAIKNNYI